MLPKYLVFLSIMACCHGDDPCSSRPCLNGGKCASSGSDFTCQCSAGFTGIQCNITEDIICSTGNPCQNGGTCVDTDDSVPCQCLDGYQGRFCEVQMKTCKSGFIKCENGGTCVDSPQEPKCNCRNGFSGEMCQERILFDCDPNPCLNEGVCTNDTCKCLPGSKGEKCEKDSYNNCFNDPCLHGGSCKDKIGYFECKCPVNWNGVQCEVKDTDFRGGRGRALVPKMDGSPEICSQRNCTLKGDNGVCDTECNFQECNYDNKDCSYGTIPWGNCQATDIQCPKVFKNGVCNPQCNNQDCLFDGFDCQNTTSSRCNDTAHCNLLYRNGECNDECNTAACDWDGLDCDESGAQNIIPGILFIVVLIEPAAFEHVEVKLLRELGHLLRAVVVIEKGEDGKKRIELWEDESEDETTNSVQVFNSSTNKTMKGTKVYLQVDERNCQSNASSECFKNTTYVAEFLTASLLTRSFETNIAFQQVRADRPETPEDSQNQTMSIIIMAAGGLLFVVTVLGVMSQRKRIRSVIWFPEGFRWSKKSNSDEGYKDSNGRQTELNLISPSTGKRTKDSNGTYRQTLDEDDVPQQKKAKMECQVSYTNHHISAETNIDQWSATHPDAAYIPHTSILSHTPPDDSLCDCTDINVKGPGGYTPLMLACIRRGGLDDDDYGNSDSGCGDEDVDISSGTLAETITDLLLQGAIVDVQTDLTGETALHLAARYAKADAVKVLLDAGANPNAQDGTGRTPLHAAVAAGATGVFQILLRNRSTNLNARTHRGATPLILASSLSIENTVQELISSDADMEAVDNNDRTALHWASAVNNVSAVFSLLKNGANRYVQDDKGQTPLFLASKEGAFETVKLLLDHCAKRNLPDYMDRLPRDIASEKMHHDIVSLLDSYDAACSSGTSPSDDATSTSLRGKAAGKVKNPRKPKSSKSKNTKTKDQDCPSAEGPSTTNVHGDDHAEPKNTKEMDEGFSGINQTGSQLRHVQTPPSSVQSSYHQQSFNLLSPMTTISSTSASADSNHSSPGLNEYFHNDTTLLPGSSANDVDAVLANLQQQISCEDYHPMAKDCASPSMRNDATFPNVLPELDISQRQTQYHDPPHYQNHQEVGQQQHVTFIKSPADDVHSNYSSPHEFHGIGEEKSAQQAMDAVDPSLLLSSMACGGNHPFAMSPTDNNLHAPQHDYHTAAFASPTYQQGMLQSVYLESPPSQYISSPTSKSNMIECQRHQNDHPLPTSQSLQSQKQECTLNIGHYPTPPAHTDELMDEPVSQTFNNNNSSSKYNDTNNANGYLLAVHSNSLPTPSPDSSSHWSSSPYSA